jgi:hypothetical protein
MKPISSDYSTFLDGYNSQFNEYANKLSAGFFDRIRVDLEIAVEATEGVLQKKFQQIGTLATSTDRSDYDKVKMTGMILQDIATQLKDTTPEVKRSASNIINSFFDVGRKTEDNDLLQVAKTISSLVKNK